MTDPEDPDISWSNSKGSKTSLRYLKIGKSTDDHVFLDCLSFLFSTFKTNEREKIFVTLDQALHFKFKSLITQGKMPQEYVDFFIVVLDPFHFQWCLLKCIYSAFENAGLKNLVGILGIDDQKWPNLLGESKNVHKAQAILQDITTSLGIFFVNFYLGTLPAEEQVKFHSRSLTERSSWLQKELPSFLEKLSVVDKSLSVFIEFYNFALLVIQCWEAQRISTYDMYIHSIKETLPYLFSFNRYNYQQSALEFLADMSLLGEYYVDLLRSGILFDSMSSQPGKEVSCGYILEIYNKIIKQITSTIDSTGIAWLRNLPRISYISQVLLNAASLRLFSEAENDPIVYKTVNVENLAKLRWVLEKRNLFEVDLVGFTMQPRPSLHVFNHLQIGNDFIECYSIGKQALHDLVGIVVDQKLPGSIESLRKQLQLRKILPFQATKKLKPKVQVQLSKAEKLALSVNFKKEDIPQSSVCMLSLDNGDTPYLGSNKTCSGRFILGNYAEEVRSNVPPLDLIVVDFMAIVFSQPPSSVYTAGSPLMAYCTWLVETFIEPYLKSSKKVVLCDLYFRFWILHY